MRQQDTTAINDSRDSHLDLGEGEVDRLVQEFTERLARSRDDARERDVALELIATLGAERALEEAVCVAHDLWSWESAVARNADDYAREGESSLEWEPARLAARYNARHGAYMLRRCGAAARTEAQASAWDRVAARIARCMA